MAPTPSPTDRPTTAPSPTATRAAASASPTQTPRTTTPPASSAAKFSVVEQQLYSALRDDAKVHCVPQRSQLPKGAVAGIECHVNSALVDTVGIYRLKDEQQAALRYLERMSAERALTRAGDCATGTAHDEAYRGTDEEVDDDEAQVLYAGHLYSTARRGCFTNAYGVANYRATCYNGLYVGILGKTAAIDALWDWAGAWPVGDEGGGPAICYGEIGGGLNDSPDLQPGDTP